MTDRIPTWVAGETFTKAMSFATDTHKHDSRKVDREPYLGHLLGVASNVIEAGGTEVQAAAALLHDVIEDSEKTYDDLVLAVGREVADIVASCTEPKFDDDGSRTRSETWWDRKNHYLRYLAGDLPGTKVNRDALVVALADKVNNCEKTARDFFRHREMKKQTIETFWDEFNAGDSCQQAWYEGLQAQFHSVGITDERERLLLRRLDRAIEDLFSKRDIIPCVKDHGHAPNHRGS